ncbi:hypothetical protein GCM10023321_48050 [Pseudonocardia eucalypti]|uniref:Transmembrane protein n=1 Tax=Pseudonocardia eucalypti TaxID=648755 RepID=A0ABP9QIG6_9PSEU|nr:hypothetical protein [Pseudonocardia eucalypti]
MNAASALTAASSLVWLGMVLGISFLEAPLKFRAPGITLPLGLGIGRLVFRALNRVELALLVVLLAAVAIARPGPAAVAGVGALALLLAAQLILVRPRLNRRSDRVLAGEQMPRSRAHHAYVALEVAKVAALVTVGFTTLLP